MGKNKTASPVWTFKGYIKPYSPIQYLNLCMSSLTFQNDEILITTKLEVWFSGSSLTHHTLTACQLFGDYIRGMCWWLEMTVSEDISLSFLFLFLFQTK